MAEKEELDTWRSVTDVPRQRLGEPWSRQHRLAEPLERLKMLVTLSLPPYSTTK